ncbi:unnamed protein product, partial [marine sediment metagenome]
EVNKKLIEEDTALNANEKKQIRQRDILIKFVTKECGITQRVVADLLSMDRSTVGDISRKGAGTWYGTFPNPHHHNKCYFYLILSLIVYRLPKYS